jgi:hypothetical protein
MPSSTRRTRISTQRASIRVSMPVSSVLQKDFVERHAVVWNKERCEH